MLSKYSILSHASDTPISLDFSVTFTHTNAVIYIYTYTIRYSLQVKCKLNPLGSTFEVAAVDHDVRFCSIANLLTPS